MSTCEQCAHCDHINHAPFGFGRYELGCVDEHGYYTIIENWTKTCEKFEPRSKK